MFANWWGFGKSRCPHTLALAAAKHGPWMGYEVRPQFRTLVLQSENDEDRLLAELLPHLKGCDDWVHIRCSTRPTRRYAASCVGCTTTGALTCGSLGDRGSLAN